MAYLIKDTFYKEKLYQLSLTSFSQAETFVVKENSQAKQLAKQELPLDIIESGLGNFAKTAEGPNYAYLSFVCTQKALYTVNVRRACAMAREWSGTGTCSTSTCRTTTC